MAALVRCDGCSHRLAPFLLFRKVFPLSCAEPPLACTQTCRPQRPPSLCCRSTWPAWWLTSSCEAAAAVESAFFPQQILCQHRQLSFSAHAYIAPPSTLAKCPPCRHSCPAGGCGTSPARSTTSSTFLTAPCAWPTWSLACRCGWGWSKSWPTLGATCRPLLPCGGLLMQPAAHRF